MLTLINNIPVYSFKHKVFSVQGCFLEKIPIHKNNELNYIPGSGTECPNCFLRGVIPVCTLTHMAGRTPSLQNALPLSVPLKERDHSLRGFHVLLSISLIANETKLFLLVHLYVLQTSNYLFILWSMDSLSLAFSPILLFSGFQLLDQSLHSVLDSFLSTLGAS